MCKEIKKELIDRNSKLSIYIMDKVSGYYKQALNNVEIICYDRKIYVPQTLHRSVIYWCHFFINHPSGRRIAKKNDNYATVKFLSHKQICILSHKRYINRSRSEILFIIVCHPRIQHRRNYIVCCMHT